MIPTESLDKDIPIDRSCPKRKLIQWEDWEMDACSWEEAVGTMFDHDELVGQSIEVRIAGRQTATNGTITRHKAGSIYLVKLGRSRAKEIDMLLANSIP